MQPETYHPKITMRGRCANNPHETFRTIAGKKFHYPRRDWVRTGRALCGANISHPSHVQTTTANLCEGCGLVIDRMAARRIVPVSAV